MSRRLGVVAVAVLVVVVVVVGLLIGRRTRLQERQETKAAKQMIGPSSPDARPWEKPGKKVGEEIVGPDGGMMVWVPAGEFDMGQEACAAPVHHVRISKGFWLGKYTVTNAQYRRYCQETGAEFAGNSDRGDDHPVVWVNWNDAVAYCKHYGLDLPTEAQWEYAARGPENRQYPWGNEWDPKKCCSEENRGPGGRTFPVGSFPEEASWCGALDMVGNVWQWCKDWYSQRYYTNSPDTDPPGPDTGDSILGIGRQCRVLRGGSWTNGYYAGCHCAHRLDNVPTNRNEYDGFRCVRTP